ncbi:MAG: DNA topoisomerase 3 [Puniceicoccales bacterium]|jgi:DNA topoisomerase-3|nr:DNA topoisomerase 3 [Puniceicoccales bacterium]
MKKLVIAEKPSVAADLAKVLGKLKKTETCYENDQYIVSWAVGHLVELFMPEDIDPQLKRWSLKSLPIIPEKFGTKPIEKTKKRFSELKQLLKRDDVDELVNACDAGREGELIFTYIYELCKCKKPFKRLWLSSMTPTGIRDAFEHLRESDEMHNLQDAAKCRSEADWLIGINGTRAITKRMFSSQSKQIATVGRVQTPTLAMIVSRDCEIANFKPTKYWRLIGEFEIKEGKYQGVFQRPEKINGKDPHDRVDRLWTKEYADKVLAAIRGCEQAAVSEKNKRTFQSAPRLYDLTSLQREANSRYGMPAAMTLKIAQSLYERHKCLTYPRTDSKALTEDYVSTCYAILQSISGECERFAKHVAEHKLVNGGNRKIFNNKQVSDHFAIIPTTHFPKSLSEEESKIYNMVLRRFIAVFYPDAEYDVTMRTSTIAGEYAFKTEGKVLVKSGWLEVYGKADLEQECTLPKLSEGDNFEARIIEVCSQEDETRPPARFNEATLLAAMEGAGKLLDDNELAEAMKERGLGTPATRAQIIDHLLNLHYLERDRRELHSTSKGEDLLNFLHALNIETLADPALTGEWEYKLRQMESGTFPRQTFMREIAELTQKIVDKVRNYNESDSTLAESEIICPLDGKPLLESFRSYHSQDGSLSIPKSLCGRKFSPQEIVQLIGEKKLGPLRGFKSKRGSEFSATIVLNGEGKLGFEFETNGEQASQISPEEIATYEELCKCPICGAPILAAPEAYICKNYFDKKCSFRMSKHMLDREIDSEQFLKLISEKSTDMLENFKSKKTGKPFKARLILKSGGKIGFAFK